MPTRTGSMYGTIYEYDGVDFSGFADEDGEILDLSATFFYPGYWGRYVKGKISWNDKTGQYRVECGANNQMADWASNSWETWRSSTVSTVDDACDYIIDWFIELDENAE